MFVKKIRLSRELYAAAKKVAEMQGYSSVDEFVAHLIERQIAADGEDQTVEEIKKKMTGLGYFS